MDPNECRISPGRLGVFYKLEVRTLLLLPGTYSVTATLLADGSTLSLGQLSVSNTRARVDLTLPTGVSVLDLAQVIVTDFSSNVILLGDVNAVMSGSTMSFSSNVKTTAGPGASLSKGRAQIKISKRRGMAVHRFTLIASHLSPDTSFNILANGVQVGTASSNKRGLLVIRSIGADLLTLDDVSVLSANDNIEALNAHF